MWTAELTGFGPAADVLRVVERDVPEPGPGEVLVQMLAAPINPADLNIIEGKYGEQPALPAVPGNEGAGRVVSTGPGVTGFAAGDLVLVLTRTCWTQFLCAPAASLVRLPVDLDPFQAAMLGVNPPTALAMLEDFVPLQPGEWVIQNAANSAVGRCLMQIARLRGWRSCNVVRRDDLDDELRALGGDVIARETDSPEALLAAMDGNRPRLALNAVGGASALTLANTLADEGVHVTYGAMGRQPLKIPNGLLIFRGLEFRGFWLRRVVGDRGRFDRAVGQLAAWMREGALTLAVHAKFPLAQVHDALRAAETGGRSGKILLDLQG